MAQKLRYKVQGLIEEGFNFNSVYPDKVDYIRNTSGMNFSLQDIVDLMRQETKNFTEDNNVAYDIDDAVAEIVAKFRASVTTTPVPATGATTTTEPSTVPSETQSLEDMKRVLRGVKRMFAEQPDNRVLRGRIRFLEEKIKNFGKMEKGGKIGKPSERDLFETLYTMSSEFPSKFEDNTDIAIQKKLIHRGWVKKKGGGYLLTKSGERAQKKFAIHPGEMAKGGGITPLRELESVKTFSVKEFGNKEAAMNEAHKFHTEYATSNPDKRAGVYFMGDDDTYHVKLLPEKTDADTVNP